MARPSNNPVLTRPGQFSTGAAAGAGYAALDDDLLLAPSAERPMTIDDVVQKTGILLGLVVLGGAAAWITGVGMGVAVVAGIAAFALAMIVIFKKATSPGLMMGYALLEGVFLGAISRAFEASYSGIVLQASIGVVLVFGVMLALYRSGRIRVTPRMTKIVMAAAVAAIGLMVVNLLVSAFTDSSLGIRDGGPLAIAFSLGMILLGAYFFAIDFDLVDRMANAGVPEREAWRAAFGLILTIVWVYLEILRLLSYLRD